MAVYFILMLVVAFLLAILAFKILSKTFKLLIFLVVFAVIFSILYFGYNSFINVFKGDSVAPSSLPNDGCKLDSDCMFVVSPGDCGLTPNSCNNLDNPSSFFKPGSSSKCAPGSISFDLKVKCSCVKSGSSSFCDKD